MENQEKIHDAQGVLLKQYGLKKTKMDKAVLNGKMSYAYGSQDEHREIDFCAFGPVAEHLVNLPQHTNLLFTAFEKRETYRTRSGEIKTESKFNVVWLEHDVRESTHTTETLTVSSKGVERRLAGTPRGTKE